MGKIAFVFSGQGAQYTGMGKELYDHFPAAKAVFDLADSIRPGTSQQCFTGDLATLSQTINTQPCVFTADLAAAKAVEALGVQPDFIAGFSLGEMAALSYSGMLSEADAFKLVCKRAELMDAAAQKNKGAMVAVMKLSPETVQEICRGFANTYPVNFNSPAQTVVATTEDTVEPLMEAVKQAKGRGKQLAVSGAFHSPFMREAAQGLQEYLKDITVFDPKMPVYANATGLPYAGDYKELMITQVENAVKWQTTVENMIEQGADTFIEVGVGKTLTGLIKKINGDVNAYKAETMEDLQFISELFK